jgi:hypothetical protein
MFSASLFGIAPKHQRCRLFQRSEHAYALRGYSEHRDDRTLIVAAKRGRGGGLPHPEPDEVRATCAAGTLTEAARL